MRRILITLLMLSSVAAASPRTAGVASLEYGFFCALEPVAEQNSDDTVSGTVQLVDRLPEFLARGTLVPAHIGVGFGLHVQVRPENAGPVVIVIQHPPMGPNAVTRQSWITELTPEDPDYVGYSFEYAYELLPGAWTMSAQSQGREIYSVTFDVVRPAKSRPNPCDRHVPLA